MSNGQYNNEDKGVLWANQNSTNPNAPAVTGKIQISRAILKKLVDDANNNLPPIIRLAGWTKQKPGTNEFYTQLKASDWDHNYEGGRASSNQQPTQQQQQQQAQSFQQPQAPTAQPTTVQPPPPPQPAPYPHNQLPANQQPQQPMQPMQPAQSQQAPWDENQGDDIPFRVD